MRYIYLAIIFLPCTAYSLEALRGLSVGDSCDKIVKVESNLKSEQQSPSFEGQVAFRGSFNNFEVAIFYRCLQNEWSQLIFSTNLKREIAIKQYAKLNTSFLKKYGKPIKLSLFQNFSMMLRDYDTYKMMQRTERWRFKDGEISISHGGLHVDDPRYMFSISISGYSSNTDCTDDGRCVHKACSEDGDCIIVSEDRWN